MAEPQPITANSSAPALDGALAAGAPPTAGGSGLAALLTLLAVCWYLYSRHREAIMGVYHRTKEFLGVGSPAAAVAPKKHEDDPRQEPAVDPSMVLRKLKALDGRLYGVQSCGWTVRQLDVFGSAKAAAREIYVDCAEPSASEACAKVTHFPTWEIKGKMMPPGMVALDVLNAQCDTMLVVAVEKMRAAAAEEDEEAPPSVLQTPPPSSPPADAPAEQDDAPETNGDAAFSEKLETDDDEKTDDEKKAEGDPEPADERAPEPAPEPGPEPADTKVPTPEPEAKKPRRRRKRA